MVLLLVVDTMKSFLFSFEFDFNAAFLVTTGEVDLGVEWFAEPLNQIVVQINTPSRCFMFCVLSNE